MYLLLHVHIVLFQHLLNFKCCPNRCLIKYLITLLPMIKYQLSNKIKQMTDTEEKSIMYRPANIGLPLIQIPLSVLYTLRPVCRV